MDKIEHLTNPYEDENWIMSWTCSDGIWSDTIQAGNVAEGEIVAKLYETGNKIKPDGFTYLIHSYFYMVRQSFSLFFTAR